MNEEIFRDDLDEGEMHKKARREMAFLFDISPGTLYSSKCSHLTS